MDKEGFKPLLAACWLLFIIKFQALLLLPPDDWRGMLLFDIGVTLFCATRFIVRINAVNIAKKSKPAAARRNSSFLYHPPTYVGSYVSYQKLSLNGRDF